MSIWASILFLDPCHEVDYGLERSVEGGYFDVALSAHYGDKGLRFSMEDATQVTLPAGWTGKPEAQVVLTRAQVAEFVEVLQRWLDNPPTS